MSCVKKIIFSFFLLLALSGCNEKITYSYLMEHPLYVKQEVGRCQTIDHKSSADKAHCEMVMVAATALMSMINEEQENPEKFGQKVMETELAYTKAKEQQAQAIQLFQELKARNASSTEVLSAQEKLNQAEKTCQDLHQKIKTLLAVLGMGSPE